jgi:hypothetical protein
MIQPRKLIPGLFCEKPFDNHYPLLIIGLVRIYGRCKIDRRPIAGLQHFTLNSF